MSFASFKIRNQEPKNGSKDGRQLLHCFCRLDGDVIMANGEEDFAFTFEELKDEKWVMDVNIEKRLKTFILEKNFNSSGLPSSWGTFL